MSKADSGSKQDVAPQSAGLQPPITVIGAGSWGTALAIQLARAGSEVTLWGRDKELMQQMQ